MKCLKQAAKRIVTAGLTLCLLLPCSVPASAALQTPAWMQAWANTRTAGVIAQLEKDQFTAKIKVDGVEGILDMVRSSGNMYLKAEEQDGTEKLTLLALDGKAYQLDSARKLAICLGDEAAAYKAMGLSETVVAKSLSTGSATGFAEAKKTVHGKTYDAEVFDMTLDGKPVEMTYCYDGGALRYLITRVGGKQASLEYLSVSDKVDESLLKMPEGYTVCTKGTDGKLYDASGKAVD